MLRSEAATTGQCTRSPDNAAAAAVSIMYGTVYTRVDSSGWLAARCDNKFCDGMRKPIKRRRRDGTNHRNGVRKRKTHTQQQQNASIIVRLICTRTHVDYVPSTSCWWEEDPTMMSTYCFVPILFHSAKHLLVDQWKAAPCPLEMRTTRRRSRTEVQP